MMKVRKTLDTTRVVVRSQNLSFGPVIIDGGRGRPPEGFFGRHRRPKAQHERPLCGRSCRSGLPKHLLLPAQTGHAHLRIWQVLALQLLPRRLMVAFS